MYKLLKLLVDNPQLIPIVVTVLFFLFLAISAAFEPEAVIHLTGDESHCILLLENNALTKYCKVE